jgi:hypothetical protein
MMLQPPHFYLGYLQASPPARLGATIARAHDVDPKVQLAMENVMGIQTGI